MLKYQVSKSALQSLMLHRLYGVDGRFCWSHKSNQYPKGLHIFFTGLFYINRSCDTVGPCSLPHLVLLMSLIIPLWTVQCFCILFCIGLGWDSTVLASSLRSSRPGVSGLTVTHSVRCHFKMLCNSIKGLPYPPELALSGRKGFHCLSL